MIIHAKRKKSRTLIELVITALGWIFLALFIWNFARHFNSRLSLDFYVLNLENSNAIILFTLLFLLFSATIMTGWSGYNKKKYGSLNRRQFPAPASYAELGEIFNTPEEEIELLQNKEYVEVK